eukprot:SAG11_NODE_317_length_10836_cov_7.445469_3_plen_73_part_00
MAAQGDGQRPSSTFGGDWEVYLSPRAVDRHGLNPLGRVPAVGQEDVPTSAGGSHSSAYHRTPRRSCARLGGR